MAAAVIVLDPANPVVAAHLGHVLVCLAGAAALLAAVIFAWRPVATWLAIDAPLGEARVHRWLRLGMSFLWAAVGISAARPSGALGLGSHALPSALTGSPAPFANLGRWCASRWLAHPTWASAGVVALGLGLALWLLAASPGRPSRLAAAAATMVAAAWWMAAGLGGLLGHGGWASGAGGAAPWLAVGGVALAGPPTWWAPDGEWSCFRRWVAAVLLALGLAQALGLRSAWASGLANPLAGDAANAANATSWPWLAGLLRSTANAAASHAAPLNLGVVLLLIVVGALLGWGRRPWRVGAAAAYALAALLAWFFACGLGAPQLGALGLGALPASALVVAAVAVAPGGELEPWAWPDVLRRSVVSLAVAGVLLGTTLGVVAACWPGADRDLAMAGGLSAAPMNGHRPPTIGQGRLDGQAFELADLHGRVGVLVFMDPICTTDCRALAREVDAAVAASGGGVVPIAVNLNPEHPSAAAMRRFASRENLASPPWVLLTGTPAQIRSSSARWQVSWAPSRGGGMLMHDDPIYVVDRTGRVATAWEAPPDETGGVQARSTVAALAEAIAKAKAKAKER